MIFEAPNVMEMIKGVVIGSGGIGGASALIIAVLLLGALLRPIFILLGMRFDQRTRVLDLDHPLFLLPLGLALLFAIPLLVNKPYLLKQIAYGRIEIPRRLMFGDQGPEVAMNCGEGVECTPPLVRAIALTGASCPLPGQYDRFCRGDATNTFAPPKEEGHSTFEPVQSHLPQIGR